MSSEPPAERVLTQDELDLLHYESRVARPVKMKLPEFERNERLRHVIFSGQFSVGSGQLTVGKFPDCLLPTALLPTAYCPTAHYSLPTTHSLC